MNLADRQGAVITDYRRIEAAIEHLADNVAEQPSLEDLAASANLSPGHIQRTFQRWAGISPKRFLQHLTVEHAKRALRGGDSVMDVALASGLTGPSRLHDHFVNLEAVTPGEFKAKGTGLDIRWGVHPSPFGYMFLAVTSRGICALHFSTSTDGRESVARVRQEWPEATLSADDAATANWAARIFDPHSGQRPLNLSVRGTNFQVQVWRALLEVPAGTVTTYASIARRIGNPGATRAVGSAIGANRIAWLIPCHRVIRANGVSGSYHWGAARKRLMNGWESVKRAEASSRC